MKIMSSPQPSPSGLIGTLEDGRYISAVALAAVYGTICVFIVLPSPSTVEVSAGVLVSAGVIYVIPHLVTSYILNIFAPAEQAAAYLDAIETSSDSIDDPFVEMPSESVEEHVPGEMKDGQTVKQVRRDLFESVEGSQFDDLDSSVRGVIALISISLLIAISGPLLTYMVLGISTPFFAALLSSALLAGLSFRLYGIMLSLIEDAPRHISS